MKIHTATIALILIIFSFSCGTGSPSRENGDRYSGIIEPAGTTTYQYGTHRLQTSNDYYALTSETIDLSEYEGEQVVIYAETIEGYPVDGGPVYLRVLKIQK